MTVKERIKEFINYKGLSVRSFESRCGLSYGYIANIRVSIQPEKVTSIAKQFPELNTGWLLTGEGEMLKDEQPPNANHSSPSGVFIPQDMYDIIKHQAETICSQQRLIEKLQAESKKTNAQTDANATCANVSGSDLVK